MKRVYYNREMPFGIGEKPTFYAYAVDISDNALAQIKDLQKILAELERRAQTAAMPRDAQALADYVAEALSAVMKTQKRKPKNVSINDTEQSD